MDTATARSLLEVSALSAAIFDDLDEVNGGISWWSGYDLALEARCGLSDYLLDVVDGIGRHLAIADFFLREYAKSRSSDDFLLRGRMRANGGSPISRDIHQRRADDATDLKLTSYVYGFFSAASSVLDTLAGTVVGVGGLGTPIVRADFGRLFAPGLDSLDYPSAKTRLSKAMHAAPEAAALQLRLIRTFRICLLQAGPQGWYTWLDQKRNQLSHRGGRLQMVAFPRLEKGPDTTRCRLLDRDPDLTTVQGFRGKPSTMESMYLLEDELTTMSGQLQSLNALVIGTIVSARSVWAERRLHPTMLPQPASQWVGRGNDSGFDGYGSNPDLLRTVNAAILNPVDAARLQSSQALRNKE